MKVATTRRFSWFVFFVGLATLGLALSPQSGQFLEITGRKSTEAPTPPRGKLGQDLFIALDHRDLNTVKALLKQGADPNSLNGLEIRPLHLAAASYQMDVMQELLAAGAKADAASTYGTPLSFASETGNIFGARILLQRGANPNSIRGDGMSVLMMACRSGNPDLVQELLKNKASVTPKDDGGETALSFAAIGGNPAMGKMLIDAGADVNSADLDGVTPLMFAAMNGQAGFAKLLLANGAKPNAKNNDGQTALVLAARYGDYPEVVKALVEGGADPKAKDTDGKVASFVARERGYGGCAKALGLNGASEMPKISTHLALDRSLKMLQSSMVTFAQSAQCVSCHHEGLGRITTGDALLHGYKLDSQLEKVQDERLEGMVNAMKPLHEAALVNPEAAKQLPLIEMNEVTTTYSWLLTGMGAHNQPRTDATAAMALVLARQQAPDGSWTFSLPRVPMQSSVFTFTALSIKALKEYGPADKASEISGRIENAKNWLSMADAKSSEDNTWKLLGLKWAGADAETMKSVETAILKDQRPDGGWAQDPTSQSDAYATGEALYALHAAGSLSTSDQVYKRGVDFLLRTQDPDGTWYENKRAIAANNYLDTGFPHGESQYASFNGSCWATLALLQTVEPKRISQR